MLIPNTLFFYILNSNGMESFPLLNKKSLGVKRFWRSKKGMERRKEYSETVSAHWKDLSDEKRQSTIKKMKKSTLNFYKKDPRALFVKKRQSEGQSLAMKEFHSNLTPEEKEQYIANLKEGHLNVDYAKARYGDDVEVVFKERINDYSGIITESQMRELMNAS